ncbi:MAG: type I methionyl aminopeptidase [Zetaproteobacteria bacterium]|nr:type I methionyl aminopeptidase [Zetaproteobacteria bacterium]
MIYLKSDNDIDAMRPAGELAYLLLEEIGPQIKPGVNTEELNTFVHNLTLQHGGISAPLGYKGFPKSVCISPNAVVCHGIPSQATILQEGDIVNVDVTPILGGMHGDSSRTFFVGTTHSAEVQSLVHTTKQALMQAIATIQPGVRLGDIGHCIQSIAEKADLSVVKMFVGHGIGRHFHEDPMVYHHGKPNKGMLLEPGMTFTIEPMLNLGTANCYILEDDWTAITKDGKWSAQFEHTLAIRSDWSVEILTLPLSHPEQTRTQT